MILAGDVGGTKTLLGLFEPARQRPVAVDVRSFPTAEYDGLAAIVSTFLAGRGGAPAIDAACFGVAGPVVGQVARLTNVPWRVSAEALTGQLGVRRVRLLNDLEAMGHAVAVLRDDELHPLQRGERRADGNAALIASGTGLGESLLHNVDGTYIPIATEGGHTDFAARNDREIALVGMLLAESGRVCLEHVVSGPGIVKLYRFTHGDDLCLAVPKRDDLAAAPPAISEAAIAGRCPRCVDTMDLYAAAYGAAAGNLGLRAMATAGVYLGGGIAAKILPILEKGAFLAAFRDKAPMEHVVHAMPVQVILNPEAALLGAAVHANTMR